MTTAKQITTPRSLANASLLPSLLKHFKADESLQREIQSVYDDLLQRAEAVLERQSGPNTKAPKTNDENSDDPKELLDARRRAAQASGIVVCADVSARAGWRVRAQGDR